MAKTKPRTLPQQVTIKRNETEPESMELVAAAILEIAEAFKRIERGPLKPDTVVLLLHNASGVGKPAIRDVMRIAPKLAEIYLKPTGKL